jgi:uncharacterized membrane protein YeiH
MPVASKEAKRLTSWARQWNHKASVALTSAEIIGTIVFAMEGSMAAYYAGSNLFSAALISVVVAVGGGVMRDLLLARTHARTHARP